MQYDYGAVDAREESLRGDGNRDRGSRGRVGMSISEGTGMETQTEPLNEAPTPKNAPKPRQAATSGFAAEAAAYSVSQGTVCPTPKDQFDPMNAHSSRRWSVDVDAAPPRRFGARCLLWVAAAVLTAVVLVCVFVSGADDDSGPRWDYIVVGGGPSGSVLARRLSDDITKRVLLLEAGGASQHELGGRDYISSPLTAFDIPLLWPSVSHLEDYHWPVLDLSSRTPSNALIARALGGCGIHNAMLYLRALPSDFDSHQDTHRNASKSANGISAGYPYPPGGAAGKLTVPNFLTWEMALKYYKDLEHWAGDGPTPPWHGTNGMVVTSPPEWIDEVAPFFLESCQAMGIRSTFDFNAPDGREGAGFYHFAIRDGVRDSAARANLGPILSGKMVRPNLVVVTGARVTRVLLQRGVSSSSSAESAFDEENSAEDESSEGYENLSQVQVKDTAENFEELNDDSLEIEGREEPLMPSPAAAAAAGAAAAAAGAGAAVAAAPAADGLGGGSGSRKPGGILGAVGVEYVIDGKIETARIYRKAEGPSKKSDGLARDIILTAGAIHTPKLLMVSGIGAAEDLASARLPLEAHVPGVGKNLQDHPSIGLMFKLGPKLLERFPSAYTIAQELERYKLNVMQAHNISFPPGVSIAGVNADDEADLGGLGSSSKFGIFSSTGLTAGAFLRSPYVPEGGPPDCQLTVFPRVTEPHILVLNKTRPVDTAAALLVTVSLLNPEGRKAVWLNTTEPVNGPPFIGRDADLPTLTTMDMKRLEWGISTVREILRHPPLSEMTLGEVTPGADEAMQGEELHRWIQDHVYANSHWCGTARMGATSADAMAVVDPTLRVRGVRNLRVADASVMMNIPNGNVHSSVVVMAKRGADMILDNTPAVWAYDD